MLPGMFDQPDPPKPLEEILAELRGLEISLRDADVPLAAYLAGMAATEVEDEIRRRGDARAREGGRGPDEAHG